MSLVDSSAEWPGGRKMNLGKKLSISVLFLTLTFLLITGIVKSDFVLPPDFPGPPEEEQEEEEQPTPSGDNTGDDTFGIAIEQIDWKEPLYWRAVDYQPFKTVVIVSNVSFQVAWTAANVYYYGGHQDVLVKFQTETDSTDRDIAIVTLIYQRLNGSYYQYIQKWQGPYLTYGRAEKKDL